MTSAWGLLVELPEPYTKVRTLPSTSTVIVRRLYVALAFRGFEDFRHIRTIFRVQSQTIENDKVISEENRYLVSSKHPTSLTFEQWLSLVRSRWGVENNLHWTLDAIFKEDDRHVIEMAPKGTLAVMLLRRVAYNLLALFRSVTLKSEKNRSLPWKVLLAWVYDTLIALSDSLLDGLRPRKKGLIATS